MHVILISWGGIKMIGCFVKHEHHGVGKILSIKGRTVAIGFYEPPIKQNYSINALQEGIIKHYLLPLGTICKVSTGEGKIIDIIRDPDKLLVQLRDNHKFWFRLSSTRGLSHKPI